MGGVTAMTRDDPHINEDRLFQTGFWRAQRVAWVLLAGLLVLALLGLTGGGGWFSQRTVGDAQFSIRYPVILRQQSEGSFVVTIVEPADVTLLHFDATFQDTFSITSMSPPPASAFATSWGVAYRFALSGTGSAIVRIKVAADHPARGNYTIVADGRMALLSTMVLP